VAGQRSFQVARRLALLLALAVLGVVIARLAGWKPVISRSSPSPSLPTLTKSVLLPQDNVVDTGRTATKGPSTLPATESSTPHVTLIGPPTPADAWANSLLDRVLIPLEQPRPSLDGFAWWQNSEASGSLMLDDGALILEQQPLSLEGQTTVFIAIPGQANPNQLERVAGIVFTQGALNLTVYAMESDAENQHWILSNARIDTAFEALVVQAAARSAVLKAAYIENPGAAVEFVLIQAAMFSEPTVTAASTLPTTTATASRTPVLVNTPTPTRQPDPYLGQVITATIDPIIDSSKDFSPAAITDFVNRHPRTGFLAWTDAGPTINGQTMSVDQARELTFYALAPSDPMGAVSSFLKVVYTENTTRLPERQIYFQAHRMEEILFWLVTRTAERGGQLRIAYDDFGAKQAITVIEFSSASQ
jgi:hypothetical protein